ncbi:MAG TPA: CARDB domain-containing protein, partial [Candidatus Methylacidiphilales bacterium]
HGFIKRAYLFALQNADGYGLLENDQVTKRPSYYALQSFIAALKDSSWNPATRKWEGGQFTPKALLFTVDGAPRTLKSITLQKQSGEYSVLFWNELPNWDSQANHAIKNPPAAITLKFQTPVDGTAEVLRQDETGAFQLAEHLNIQNGVASVDVPSAVIIVRIKTPVGMETTAVPSPTGITSSTSANSVTLHWTAGAGSNPAGYFVFRNGWCIASTTETSFEDRTPWIRPGLGYTYAVQGYDKNGSLSPRTTQIVQTSAKFPDYVITDFGLEKQDVKPGDAVRFHARVKNIGAGATPVGTPLAVTFSLDGKTMSWGGADGLAPGEERDCVGTGGPHPIWTAAEGSHLLVACIDDLDRVPEESDKINNVQDKTISIGGSARGELLGASQEAPWKIDLTREGTEDWIQWGVKDIKSVDRKAKVNEISDVAKMGGGFMASTGGFTIRTAWNDGSPTPSMDATNSSLWVNGIGSGYSFTAPADTTERMLKVYAAGINGAACSLTATLSDNSAAPYVSKTWTGNSGHGSWAAVPGDFSVVYTIRYRAASAAQTLKIEYKLEDEPNRFAGQARLGAATLEKVGE